MAKRKKQHLLKVMATFQQEDEITRRHNLVHRTKLPISQLFARLRRREGASLRNKGAKRRSVCGWRRSCVKSRRRETRLGGG